MLCMMNAFAWKFGVFIRMPLSVRSAEDSVVGDGARARVNGMRVSLKLYFNRFQAAPVTGRSWGRLLQSRADTCTGGFKIHKWRPARQSIHLQAISNILIVPIHI